MNLRRRKNRRARAADKLSGVRSGAAKVAHGTGQAGRAAGRSGKAVAVYGGRKAAGKRAPLLVSAPALAGASIATFLAVRKLRRGVKQTVPK
jgi:hypothetical protein